MMIQQRSEEKEQKPDRLLRSAMLVGIAVAAVYFVRGNASAPGQFVPTPNPNETALNTPVPMIATLIPSSPGPDVLSGIVVSHAEPIMHTHTQLSITINGQQEPIPANIGITKEGMRVVHTHDDSGMLHIESPNVRTYTLGDFFIIWNRTFNRQCIFEYCADENHTVSVLVDDVPTTTFEYTPLLEGKRIQIIYAARRK